MAHKMASGAEMFAINVFNVKGYASSPNKNQHAHATGQRYRNVVPVQTFAESAFARREVRLHPRHTRCSALTELGSVCDKHLIPSLIWSTIP